MKFSDSSQKLKNWILVLSGICLFIATTGSLPTNISIIGLDLKSSQNVAGWFLFSVTVYFTIKLLIVCSLELMHYKLPTLISRITRDIKGDYLGLTEDEVHLQDSQHDHNQDDMNIGTPYGELETIRTKREKINTRYNRNFLLIHNGWIYVSDFVLPVCFSIFSTYALYTLLESNSPFKILWWAN